MTNALSIMLEHRKYKKDEVDDQKNLRKTNG